MYAKEMKIPQEITVTLEGKKVKVSGDKGDLERSFNLREIKIEMSENKIKVSSDSERRKTKSLVGAVMAHVRNMFEGVKTGYTYRLRVVFSHFPVTAKVDGQEVLIQNFMGERTSRVAKIAGQAKVEVKGQDITVIGSDLGEVGETASNIEQATRIIGYDRRRFPDGIFLTAKE